MQVGGGDRPTRETVRGYRREGEVVQGPKNWRGYRDAVGRPELQGKEYGSGRVQI